MCRPVLSEVDAGAMFEKDISQPFDRDCILLLGYKTNDQFKGATVSA